jgi:glycosyltransferase involved in cell wall biosynthesis
MRGIAGILYCDRARPVQFSELKDAKQRNATEMRRAQDGPVVCHVLHGLTIGGAEVLAARLVRQLRGSFRFTFVCLDELGPLGEELRAEGFLIHVLGRRPGVDLGCSRRLARFLREQNVDLLHCHQYSPFFYGICARLLCRRPPVLFTEHGRPHPDFPRRKRIVANRLLLERRDRVISVGQAVRQALVANEGIPADRVAVICNGVNLAQPAACHGRRDEVRRELNLGSNDLVLLHVARLHPIKDHATALRMLALMLGRQPNSRLILAGEGPEREIIQRHIAELGIGQKVRLLGVRSDVPRLLAAADIAILTSLNEGIPLTLIEAMAAGLPVVATNVGGVGEIVKDGVSGFLAAAADPAALAGKALLLATDPELRSRMGESGRARAHALFSEARMLAEYRHLYEEMLGD